MITPFQYSIQGKKYEFPGVFLHQRRQASLFPLTVSGAVHSLRSEAWISPVCPTHYTMATSKPTSPETQVQLARIELAHNLPLRQAPLPIGLQLHECLRLDLNQQPSGPKPDASTNWATQAYAGKQTRTATRQILSLLPLPLGYTSDRQEYTTSYNLPTHDKSSISGEFMQDILPATTWYNYTYSYPDEYIRDGVNLTDIVFYVGKGQKGRIDSHEREAKTGCECDKCKVIREIWANGYPVKKRLVFETLIEEKAFTNERELISKYAGKYLTNVTHNIPQEYKKSTKLSSLTGSLNQEEAEVFHLLLGRRDSYKISEIEHVSGRTYSLTINEQRYNAVILPHSFEFYEKRYHIAKHVPDLVICHKHNTVLAVHCLSLEAKQIAMPYELPAQITDIEAQRHKSKTASQALLGMYLCGMEMAQDIISKLPHSTQKRYLQRAKELNKHKRGRPVNSIAN